MNTTDCGFADAIPSSFLVQSILPYPQFSLSVRTATFGVVIRGGLVFSVCCRTNPGRHGPPSTSSGKNAHICIGPLILGVLNDIMIPGSWGSGSSWTRRCLNAIVLPRLALLITIPVGHCCPFLIIPEGVSPRVHPVAPSTKVGSAIAGLSCDR